jgi:hypothetical protein
MTWTYDQTFPSDKDRIRLLTGDRDILNQQISDEEINELLLLEGNPAPLTTAAPRPVLYRAASHVATGIAGNYAGMVGVTTGKERIEAANLMKNYQALAKDLMCRANSTGIGPRVGGMSLAEKLGNAQDADLVQPAFRRDMMSEPGTGPDAGTQANDNDGDEIG